MGRRPAAANDVAVMAASTPRRVKQVVTERFYIESSR